jgi:hypothetical protein
VSILNDHLVDSALSENKVPTQPSDHYPAALQGGRSMGKIIRREFLGSWVLFLLLCLTIVGIPVAILYYVENVITVEEKLEDPSAFLADYRAGKYKS